MRVMDESEGGKGGATSQAGAGGERRAEIERVDIIAAPPDADILDTGRDDLKSFESGLCRRVAVSDSDGEGREGVGRGGAEAR